MKFTVYLEMFLIGILIHLTFLFSVFDIYFVSPIVKNVVPYQPSHQGVADRLVLFVCDGLRAESFVNYTTMDYLRSIANTHGRWGISHTQAPTESRPGHVAIIAGFYEDPSAIAKMWKENPVDFDSVFNQTARTLCWGTCDIVNLFTKGLSGNHVLIKDCGYHHMFDEVKEFFNSAKSDEQLQKQLKEKKIVLFLHLLDTDVADKPKTTNFLKTLIYVDQGIKEIEKLIRDYYNDDGKTTFLMTSDHGMTDWGNHGGGSNHETETPYVIWGAGVQQKNQLHSDPNTLNMSLEHRLDVDQVDLAPLMSTILSIPVPVNSIGRPTDGLLNMSLPDRAKAIYSVSRQLASQYDKKRQDVESKALTMLYSPFRPLTKTKLDASIDFAEKLIEDKKFDELILLCTELIEQSLTGLTYYHNYYQGPLLFTVTLFFIGLIAYSLKVLSEQKANTQTENSDLKKYRIKLIKLLNGGVIFWRSKIILLFICFVACSLIYAQSFPIQYYVYFLMPIVFWWYALVPIDVWVHAFRDIKRRKSFCKMGIEVVCYMLGLIAMALSFTYRWMLSIPLLGMGLWPFFSSSRSHLPKTLLFTWTMGCVLLSVFLFIPVVGKDVFIELVILAGFIWIFLIILYQVKLLLPLYYNKEEDRRELVLNAVQMILLIISLHNIYVQSKRFENETFVSYYHKAVTWIIAIISPVLLVAFSTRMLCRLVAINTSLLNFYLLLSVSHEGLFMVTLMTNLMCWVVIEFRLLNVEDKKIVNCRFHESYSEENPHLISVERSISDQDFRRAFIFVLYIMLAFFGTGNLASLDSLQARWVRCFITSYHPFVITFLRVLKTLAPFMSVACSSRAVQHLTKAPKRYLNIIVLIYSNIMGTLLLFNVRNTGSWLEMGTSITQFVIVQLMTLFIVIINQIAKILTDVNIHNIAGTKRIPQYNSTNLLKPNGNATVIQLHENPSEAGSSLG